MAETDRIGQLKEARPTPRLRNTRWLQRAAGTMVCVSSLRFVFAPAEVLFVNDSEGTATTGAGSKPRPRRRPPVPTLPQAVARALERRGVLTDLRARLRHEVFRAIDEEANPPGPDADDPTQRRTPRPRVAALLARPEGAEAFRLVHDLLQWCGLGLSLGVLEPEAGGADALRAHWARHGLGGLGAGVAPPTADETQAKEAPELVRLLANGGLGLGLGGSSPLSSGPAATRPHSAVPATPGDGGSGAAPPPTPPAASSPPNAEKRRDTPEPPEDARPSSPLPPRSSPQRPNKTPSPPAPRSGGRSRGGAAPAPGGVLLPGSGDESSSPASDSDDREAVSMPPQSLTEGLAQADHARASPPHLLDASEDDYSDDGFEAPEAEMATAPAPTAASSPVGPAAATPGGTGGPSGALGGGDSASDPPSSDPASAEDVPSELESPGPSSGGGKDGVDLGATLPPGATLPRAESDGALSDAADARGASPGASPTGQRPALLQSDPSPAASGSGSGSGEGTGSLDWDDLDLPPEGPVGGGAGVRGAAPSPAPAPAPAPATDAPQQSPPPYRSRTGLSRTTRWSAN